MGVEGRGGLLTNVRRYGEPEAFLERAGPFLLEREAEHCMILGISSSLRDSPKEGAYLVAVEEDGRVVAVAVRTPSHNLVVSHVTTPEVIGALARHVQEHAGAVPGVMGPKRWSQAFAERWQELTGSRLRQTRAMRIHQADTVKIPSGVPGELRGAQPEDRGLLIGWARAFEREALGSDDTDGAVRSVDDALALSGGDVGLSHARSPGRGLFLWEDRRPVSMAEYSGRTPHGVRIVAVYTPPELRGRGYASACVAALTQRLLDGGRRFCFLFTDLANPTSNRIYARMGYQPVCDVDEYRFS